MFSYARLRKLSAPRLVRPEALNVTPGLLGTPLAGPWKRLFAIGVDATLVAIISSISGAWILICAAVLGIRLHKRADIRKKRTVMGAILVVFLLWLGGRETWQYVHHRIFTKPIATNATSVTSKESNDSDVDADEKSPTSEKMSDAARIAALESELESAKKSHPVNWMEQVKAFFGTLGLSFGWSVLYFSLVPYWWPGQTVGKKLLGLRVVDLTGKPLKVMHCFNRYGGYAAGMATGLLGFAQIFWDINRQAIQDKIAHTVVIDTRTPKPLNNLVATKTERRDHIADSEDA